MIAARAWWDILVVRSDIYIYIYMHSLKARIWQLPFQQGFSIWLGLLKFILHIHSMIYWTNFEGHNQNPTKITKEPEDTGFPDFRYHRIPDLSLLFPDQISTFSDHLVCYIFIVKWSTAGRHCGTCASCQICKIAGCARAGNAGDVFPAAAG